MRRLDLLLRAEKAMAILDDRSRPFCLGALGNQDLERYVHPRCIGVDHGQAVVSEDEERSRVDGRHEVRRSERAEDAEGNVAWVDGPAVGVGFDAIDGVLDSVRNEVECGVAHVNQPFRVVLVARGVEVPGDLNVAPGPTGGLEVREDVFVEVSSGLDGFFVTRRSISQSGEAGRRLDLFSALVLNIAERDDVARVVTKPHHRADHGGALLCARSANVDLGEVRDELAGLHIEHDAWRVCCKRRVDVVRSSELASGNSGKESHQG